MLAISKHFGTKTYCVCRQDGSWVIADNGYSKILLEESSYLVEKDGRSAHYNQEGIAMVEEILHLTDKVAIGRCFKWGFIFDGNEKEAIYDYETIEKIDNCYLLVKKDGYNIATYEGHLLFGINYSELSYSTRSQLIIARKNISNSGYRNEKYGVINLNEKSIVGFRYDSIEELDAGFFVVKEDGHVGITNLRGRTVIPCTSFTEIEMVDGHFRCTSNGITGDYTLEGKPIPVLEPIGNMLYRGKHMQKYALLSEDEVALTDYEFSNIYYQAENRIIVSKKDTDGKIYASLIDNQGKVLIDFNQHVTSFMFVDGKLFGMIGKEKYEFGQDFQLLAHMDELDDICNRATKFGKMALFDKNNGKVSDFIYSNIQPFSIGKYMVQIENKWGIINAKGELLLECKFDKLTKISETEADAYWTIYERNIGYGYRGNPYHYYKKVSKNKHVFIGSKPKRKCFLKVGDECIGTIVAKKEFGIFIDIPKKGRGLLHKSQFAGNSLSSFTTKTSIKVQVIEIRERDNNPTFKLLEYPLVSNNSES